MRAIRQQTGPGVPSKQHQQPYTSQTTKISVPREDGGLLYSLRGQWLPGRSLTTLSTGESRTPFKKKPWIDASATPRALPSNKLRRKPSYRHANMRERIRCRRHWTLSKAQLGPQAFDGPAEAVRPPVYLSGGKWNEPPGSWMAPPGQTRPAQQQRLCEDR